MARAGGIVIVAAILALVLSAGALRAEDDDPIVREFEAPSAHPRGPAGPPRDDDPIVLEFEAPIPIADLIQKVGEETALPLVWDPKSRGFQNKQVVGDVRLEGTREEILEGLRSLLTYYELVIIPSGSGPNRKLMIMDVRQSAAIMRLKPVCVDLTDENVADYADKDGLFLTTTIKVENMENLRDARNALNRIVTGQNIGNVTEVPAARAFVVTDFAPNVVAIYRLIQRMDMPFEERGPDAGSREVVFRAVRLKHASAAIVANTLVAQFGANEPAPAPTRSRTPQQQTSDVPPDPALRIHADERLNQVLVTGMLGDVDRVLEVVAALDQPMVPLETRVELIRLENIQATGAAAALSQLILRAPAMWRGGPGAGDVPVVEAHHETNALLVHASEGVATTLRRLITEMDREVEGGDASPAADDPATRLVLENLERPVTLCVEDRPITEVLGMFSQLTGIPIVLTPRATRVDWGAVSLEANDLSGRLVLDMIVKAPGTLKWRVVGGTVIVSLQDEHY